MHENKHETLNNPGMMVASAAALIGATVLHNYWQGGRENAALRTETELLTNEVMNAEFTVVCSVGCMQSAKQTFEYLVERFPDVNLIVPQLPQFSPNGRIDRKPMCKQVANQLIRTGARKPILWGDSKGTLDNIEVVQYCDETGVTEEIDGFGRIIANASPHDGEDITDSRRRLLLGAKIFQHFSAPNHMKPFFMRLAGHQSSAAATLSETVLAGRDIQKAPAFNKIPATFEQFIYVRGPHEDPTVHTKAASAKFRQEMLPALFREYIDGTRGPGAHIGNNERYDLLATLAGVPMKTAMQEPQYEEEIIYLQPQAA